MTRRRPRLRRTRPRWPRAGAWLTVLVVVTPVLGFAALLPGILRAVAGLPAPVLVGSGLLYLAAHALRAVRLASLATPILGLSGRSGSLLHIVTAPGAMILPFKLGEAIRIQQLWQAGRSLSGALTVVLLERSVDAVMLLLLLLYLSAAGTALSPSGSWLLVLTLCAVLLAVVAFVLAPRVMTAVQCYIVRNHRQPQSLRQLGRIDAMRRTTLQAASIMREQGPILLILSALIWALELAAVLVLLAPGAGAPAAGAVLVDRLLGGSMVLVSEPRSTVLYASTALGMLVVALAWAPALRYYLGRIGHEPIRARRGLLRASTGKPLAA